MISLQARNEKEKKEPRQGGDWSIVPLEQMPYTAQERTNGISVLIRPEAGLTFSVSEYSKFTARFQYGIGIGEPLIVH